MWIWKSFLFAIAFLAVEPSFAAESLWITDGPVETVLETNGVIYVGGKFSFIGRRARGMVALDRQTGTVDPSFPKLSGSVRAIVSDGEGGLYLAGSFRDNPASTNLIHIRGDHTLDTSWNPQIDGQVWTMVRYAKTLYVSGLIRNVAGERRQNLAAIDAKTAALLPWNPELSNGSARHIAVWEDSVYLSYPINPGHPAIGKLGLVSVEASTGRVRNWPAGNLIDSVRDTGGSLINVRSLEASARGLMVGGMILIQNHSSPGKSPSRLGFLILDHTNGSLISNYPVNGPTGFITDIHLAGSTMYLAGDVAATNQPTPVGSRAYILKSILAVDLETGANHRGFPQFTSSMEKQGFAMVEHLAAEAGIVYAAGRFDQVGDLPRRGLVALDVKSQQVIDWDPGVFGRINAVALSSRNVYVGGLLTSVNNLPRRNFAAIDAATGHVLEWAPNPDGPVKALRWTDGGLVLEGDFSTFNGERSNGSIWVNRSSQIPPGMKQPSLASGEPVQPHIRLLSRVAFVEVRDGVQRALQNESASNHRFVLEASSDLRQWIPLTTNQIPFVFHDVDAEHARYRFYRVMPLKGSSTK